MWCEISSKMSSGMCGEAFLVQPSRARDAFRTPSKAFKEKCIPSCCRGVIAQIVLLSLLPVNLV